MKKPVVTYSKKESPHKIYSGGHRGVGMKIDNLPVRDAKEGLTLEVTADDIRHSNPKDPAGCAAAVAVMRQEGVTKALVHLSKVYIKRDKYWERYESPRSLRTEVIVFDRRGEFSPEEFMLNAPPHSHLAAVKRKTWREKYKLQKPAGKNALPRKSTWKTHGKEKSYAKGTKPRRHIVANVRGRPSGFHK